jgi:hypothetical protein
MTQGGKRPGAGRPKKAHRPKQPRRKEYASAHDYLQAVACGLEPSDDQARISAAKALLPYESPKTRVRKPSPPPKTLQRAAETQAHAEHREDWERRSAKVRARFQPT